jgi:regulatory protein
VQGRSRSASARTRASSGVEPAFDAAVRYLGARPRSVLEVRRHLTKKRYDEKQIAAALARLREMKYVDDAAFARYWLEQRRRFRPKGADALRSELRAKGVDAAIVDEVLAEPAEGSAENEAAIAALGPKLARWSGLPLAERKSKAQALLRQRGFSFETIEEVLARLYRSGG